MISGAPFISILGVYNETDGGVFSGFSVPTGMNRETAISKILYDNVGLSLIYSDPVVLGDMISIWSKTSNSIWEKLYATEKLEYNPIDNYDRLEEWTDSSETGTTVTVDATYTDDTTESQKVMGFNNQQSVDGDSVKTEGTNTTDSTNTSNSTASNTHTGRVHGNIGVTSTQDLIKQQREVANFNTYDFISKDFRYNFCTLVY